MNYDGIGYTYVDGCDCVSVTDPMTDYRDEDIDFHWDQDVTPAPPTASHVTAPKLQPKHA